LALLAQGKGRLQPLIHIHMHLNVAVTTATIGACVRSVSVCVGTHFIMLVMLCIPQNTPYRPGPDAEEKDAAQKQNLSWDMRAHQQPDQANPQVPKVKFHGNQKARGSGRVANNGGFKKRAQWVYKASDWDPFYDLENDAGRFAYLCILVL
jgi:hypothetical protein